MPFDHEHQTAGLLDLQLPCIGVGHEPGLPHYLEYMLLGLRPDIGPVVDDTRNGAYRAAADPGNVLNGQIRHFVGVPHFR